MKNIPIHVVLPKSFIDQMNASLLDVAHSLSVAYGDKQVDFQVDLVPDDFFEGSVTWLS